MPGNSFGKLFKITTWGESHGKAVGVVIDGCPPKIPLTEEVIQAKLDRRRPGRSNASTTRQEPDRAVIMSGIFEGRTTGTPISIVIHNRDARSKSYAPYQNRNSPPPATAISPTEPNMGFATGAAAAVPRPAKPPPAWLPGPWRQRFWPLKK